MSNIQATTRDTNAHIAALRTSGMIPAVFYGAGKPTTSISVSQSEFQKVWKEAGESSTITLTLDNEKVDVLIHEVQFDPVKGTPIHVDFLVVDMNKPVQVAVPVEFEGVSPAAKSNLGTLVKVMYEIEVKALPKNLPHAIVADLSKLQALHNQILVSDLKFPAGVTPVPAADEVVASLAAQVEESNEPQAPVDLSKIEVEKKGKKEEEAAAE